MDSLTDAGAQGGVVAAALVLVRMIEPLIAKIIPHRTEEKLDEIHKAVSSIAEHVTILKDRSDRA